MIDGVCGGVAEFFNVDSTLVRLFWVLLTFLGGSGIVLYIVAMIIMPVNPETVVRSKPAVSNSNQRFWGFLLIGIGVVLLLANLGFSIWMPWWGFSWELIVAIILILAGVAFIFGGRNYVSAQPQSGEADATGGIPPAGDPPPVQPAARLYKSRVERKLFGVCGGLATYFGIDPTIIRLLFVISALVSCGLTVVAYVVMAIVTPEEPSTAHAS